MYTYVYLLQLCVYSCKQLYSGVHMCIHKFTCIFVVYTPVYTNVNMCILVYNCLYLCIYVYTHVNIFILVYTSVQACIHAYP